MPRYNLLEKQEAICLRRVCRTHVSQRGDYICTNSNGAGTSRAPNIQTSPAMHTDTSSRPRFFVNGSTVLPFHNTITITTTTTTLKVTIVPYSSGPYLTNHCELHVAAVSKTHCRIYRLSYEPHHSSIRPSVNTIRKNISYQTDHSPNHSFIDPGWLVNMCYHKYTHYTHCGEHIPMHTHMCPKNITEDQTRVIFCEDYQAVRVEANADCPHCEPLSHPHHQYQHRHHHHRAGSSPSSSSSSSVVVVPVTTPIISGRQRQQQQRQQQGGGGGYYPTPPKTATPGSTR